MQMELKINYPNAAYGDKLIAKAQVFKSGKRLWVVWADAFSVQDKAEVLVATSFVTLMQLQNRNNETQID